MPTDIKKFINKYKTSDFLLSNISILGEITFNQSNAFLEYIGQTYSRLVYVNYLLSIGNNNICNLAPLRRVNAHNLTWLDLSI